jgi:hypothetical protein
MPLPPYLVSANVLICERVLHEDDGVISAIRIVDVFTGPNVSVGMFHVVQAHALVMLKAIPGHTGEHNIEIKLMNAIGELSSVAIQKLATFSTAPELEGKASGGISINIQLNIGVKNYGSYCLYVYLDGEEIARALFMILPLQGEAKKS